MKRLFFVVLLFGLFFPVFASHKDKINSFDTDVSEKRADIDRSLTCMAMNLYHEARGEGELGMVAVAHVVLNRAKSKNFPSDVCEVIKQVKPSCQFSWFCTGKIKDIDNWDKYDHARSVAINVMNGQVTDPTNGALYYHTVNVKPKWRKRFIKVAKIGSHIFYKDKNMEKHSV